MINLIMPSKKGHVNGRTRFVFSEIATLSLSCFLVREQVTNSCKRNTGFDLREKIQQLLSFQKKKKDLQSKNSDVVTCTFIWVLVAERTIW